MEGRSSRVGPGIECVERRAIPRQSTPLPKRKLLFALSCALAIMMVAVAFVGLNPSTDRSAQVLAVTVLPIILVDQHYDTAMPCIACLAGGLPPPPHVPNDVWGPDSIYGTADDCPHCSAYCAPASIAMIATYRGMGPPFFFQDSIYDSSKTTNGEIPGNNLLDIHGDGMFDGSGGWPAETQNAMFWALGVPIIQYDWNPANLNGPMKPALLQQFIGGLAPVLWLDHGGWPANQSPTNPPPAYRLTDQGHAKVIAGYDDNGTALNVSDDLCLIFDPWPEYNFMSILPPNCTLGPGGTFDPYWQPLNDVNLSDVQDIYLVDTFPLIPEFTNVLVPVLGIMAAVAIALRRRR